MLRVCDVPRAQYLAYVILTARGLWMRLVVTTFGCGKAGYSDGRHSEAKLNRPTGLCLSLDGETLMCADGLNRRIRRIDLSDGLGSTYVGSGQTEFKNGARLESNLHHPFSVCADPFRPNSYFIGDISSIRSCDGETVLLIAGGESTGYKDGVGAKANASSVYALLCASDGQTLYFSDCGNFRLRCVDLKTDRQNSLR